MGAIGSVLTQPTVVANTLTAETANFPSANLMVIGIYTSASYISIPIDPSRNAIIANGGSSLATYPARSTEIVRRVNIPIHGTTLAYSICGPETAPTTVFYYGSPYTGAKDFTQYEGIVTAVTLAAGLGTGTLTFPGGALNFTGITAAFGNVAANTAAAVLITINTATGQSLAVWVTSRLFSNGNEPNQDVVGLSLKTQQTVTFTLNGNGGAVVDVVQVIAYYSGSPQ